MPVQSFIGNFWAPATLENWLGTWFALNRPDEWLSTCITCMYKGIILVVVCIQCQGLAPDGRAFIA